MSAPEVGDRVRVIAGQWTGWHGTVLDRLHHGWLWVNLTSTNPAHTLDPLTFTRCLRLAEAEKAPTTRQNGPQSHADASGAPVEVPGANGAQNGSER